MITMTALETQQMQLDIADHKDTTLTRASIYISRATHYLALGRNLDAADQWHMAAVELEQYRKNNKECSCDLRPFFGGGVWCCRHGLYR